MTDGKIMALQCAVETLNSIKLLLAGYQAEEEEKLTDTADERKIEQLEENSSLLDEAAFFIEEAVKNLKAIPEVAE